jgi:hypothetical protein
MQLRVLGRERSKLPAREVRFCDKPSKCDFIVDLLRPIITGVSPNTRSEEGYRKYDGTWGRQDFAVVTGDGLNAKKNTYNC